jgi:hypothetical protein
MYPLRHAPSTGKEIGLTGQPYINESLWLTTGFAPPME